MILLQLILLTSGIITPSLSRIIKPEYSKFWEEDENEIHSIRAGPEQNPKCNESAWPIKYAKCKGLFQSPINIPSEKLTVVYNEVPPLCWKNYDVVPKETSLHNEAYTIDMVGKWADGKTPSISCGVLGNKEYEFVQWHCHWSNTSDKGSEHSFNGNYYPMECHFVHFNKAYGNFTNALNYKDGLAVIGYVYDLSFPSTFPGMLLGGALLRMARQEQEEVNVFPLPLSYYAPTFTNQYVTYAGSLTTPPCSESVTWIINIKARRISPLLLRKFRRVARTSECMVDNYRDIQDLNGRDIQFIKNVA